MSKLHFVVCSIILYSNFSIAAPNQGTQGQGFFPFGNTGQFQANPLSSMFGLQPSGNLGQNWPGFGNNNPYGFNTGNQGWPFNVGNPYNPYTSQGNQNPYSPGNQNPSAAPGNQNPYSSPGNQNPSQFPGNQNPSQFPGNQNPSLFPGNPSAPTGIQGPATPGVNGQGPNQNQQNQPQQQYHPFGFPYFPNQFYPQAPNSPPAPQKKSEGLPNNFDHSGAEPSLKPEGSIAQPEASMPESDQSLNPQTDEETKVVPNNRKGSKKPKHPSSKLPTKNYQTQGSKPLLQPAKDESVKLDKEFSRDPEVNDQKGDNDEGMEVDDLEDYFLENN